MVINPYVINTKDHTTSDIFSETLKSRVIHMVGEVCDEQAATIVAQLQYLEADDPKRDIHLYINSPGGSVTAGLAIYDTMQYISPDVCTVCIGHAASMGAVILSGGTKGKRFLLPHSEVMIHQPSGGTQGQASDMLIAAEHIKRTREVLYQILAENCGKSIDQIVKDSDRDYWMSAQEALDYGIIDKVLTKRNEA